MSNMMLINSFGVVIALLLFMSSCHVSLAGRKIPSSAPSTVVRPLDDRDDYVSLRPHLNQKGGPAVSFGGAGGREIKGCLPKGFRHASAPSRFVNYHPLGSAGCNTSSDVRAKKP